MAIRRRILRSVGAGLLLLALAIPVVFFSAARALEYFLQGERRFGEITLRLHGPEVSLRLALRADSVTLLAPGLRLDLFDPHVRLVDGFTLDPSGATLFAAADSASLRLEPPAASPKDGPVPFPPDFRFPMRARVEWRTLVVRAPDGTLLEAGRGSLRSRGAYGAEGRFDLRASSGGPAAPTARVEADARWAGESLRYRAWARSGRDSLRILGARDKRDLRHGVDSIVLASERPERWLPPALAERLPEITGLRVAGTADWKARNLQVTGAASTGEWHLLRPCDWNFEGNLRAGGGRFEIAGQGGGQTFRARGSWSHPEAWLEAPDWRQCQADLTADVRGVSWKIGPFTLPIEFNVPAASLRRGLDARARVRTGDGSDIDVRWDGDRPGRLEFSGPVAPREAWAVAWTDSQLFYRSAHVDGYWEDGKVRATARVRDVLAYSAEADSVLAVNEVTSSQYTLRSATIYKDGEAFTGSGWVRWRDPKPVPGRHPVSLRFEASHPRYGKAEFAMPRLKAFEGAAHALSPANFPYRPLARFKSFEPTVDGTFRWDLNTGAGETGLDLALTSGGRSLQGELAAVWTRDTLRVEEGEMTSGAARVSGRAVLPLEGKSLPGLSGLRTLAGGTWRIGVDSLRAGDVFAIAGRSSRPLEGDVNGLLEYSPASGLRGDMRIGGVEIPALRDHAEIAGASVIGLGDSVRIEIALASRRNPLFNDTVQAMVTGLDSDMPRFFARNAPSSPLAIAVAGQAPRWTMLTGAFDAAGSIPLGTRGGRLDSIALAGVFSAPLDRFFARDFSFRGSALRARYAFAGESQLATGTPSYAEGTLRVPDLRVRNGQGGAASGRAEASFHPLSARAEIEGERFEAALPKGQSFRLEKFSAEARWRDGDGLTAELTARSGSFALPPSPYRVEGAYENLKVSASLPPSSAPATPARLAVRGRIHDFLFERKLADRKIERDLGALFNFGRGGAPRSASGPRRARAWDLDIDVDATGSRNRIETDVLRMNFIGDMRVKGVPPYLLVTGRVSGLQGEIGQARQAYDLRDFEVKWDNAALEEGRITVEGEKRVRVDCRVETKQTCPFYVRVDGRLKDANFTYDTDCGQSGGEPVAPTVLITSMSRGCYAGETAGDAAYGSAALASLEPLISGQLSRGFARGSGGFIKSTQVSGLGAIVGGDSAGLEAVSLEVESREVYRVGLKGKAGYHPETKQTSPMEYRMAAEYRPPLERWAADSTWRARLKDRFTVEAAVETRPETRDIEEERRVQQRVGLRYRYRFWDLW